AGLDDVEVRHADRLKVNPVAAPEHGRRGDRIGKSDSRHEVLPVVLPESPGLAVHAGKGQTNEHAELINGYLRNRIGCVVSFYSRLDRTRRIEVESAHAAVEALGHRRGRLIA